MAQNFVGSNNINLLMPNGQFGSRNQGGKEHASARYVFTCLSKVTRMIFPEPDDHSLKYFEDDGQLVEPEYYVPIIPMVLVNGNQGIGTGWSTMIPNYNPRELCSVILSKLNGQDFPDNILPWYKGYRGEVVMKSSNKGVETRGIIEV
jgi:DNA topoisomerase-2